MMLFWPSFLKASRVPRPRFGRAVLLAILGTLALIVPEAATSALAAEQTPVLRACFDPDDLPFSQKAPGAGGGDQGLYVDLASAIAEKLGRRLEPVWYVMQFAGHAARETLPSGKCDAFFALPSLPGGMGPRIIFSRPILHGAYALVTPPGMVVDRLDDLVGKRVAVQFATPPQGLLAQHGGITLVTSMNPAAAFATLAAHEADSAILWGPSAGYLNQTLYAGRFTVTPLAGDGMQFDAAIGFDSRQAVLRDAVNQALESLGGIAATLARKYGLPAAAPRELSAATPARRHAGVMPRPPFRLAPFRLVAEAPAGNPQNGREIINTYCAHCHGIDARAPVRRQNLHFLRERYGDNMDQVFMTTVHNGRPDKGMPNWSGVLTEDQFKDVLAYLHTSQD